MTYSPENLRLGQAIERFKRAPVAGDRLEQPRRFREARRRPGAVLQGVAACRARDRRDAEARAERLSRRDGVLRQRARRPVRRGRRQRRRRRHPAAPRAAGRPEGDADARPRLLGRHPRARHRHPAGLGRDARHRDQAARRPVGGQPGPERAGDAPPRRAARRPQGQAGLRARPHLQGRHQHLAALAVARRDRGLARRRRGSRLARSRRRPRRGAARRPGSASRTTRSRPPPARTPWS